MRNIVVAACAVSLTGCASGAGGYIQPGAETPHATLELSSTVNSWDWNHPSQMFSYFDNANCDGHGAESLLALMYIDTPKESSVRIPTTGRVYLRAATLQTVAALTGGNIATSTDACTSLTSFTPAAGRRYAVKHYRTGQECRMEIVAADGSGPPADIQQHAMTSECAQPIRRQGF